MPGPGKVAHQVGMTKGDSRVFNRFVTSHFSWRCGPALNFAQEAAGAENPFGVEAAFYLAHQGKAVGQRSPAIEARLLGLLEHRQGSARRLQVMAQLR